MARTFLTPIDFNGLELLNTLAQNLATPPAHAVGRFYFDTTLGKLGISDGSAWTYVGDGAGDAPAIDAEAVQDIVGTLIKGQGGITVVYDDELGTLTVSAVGATEAQRGIVELATAAEVMDGTDVERAVTPARLKTELDKKVSATELAATVKSFRLDEFAAPITALNLNGQRISAVGTPTADTDAANKNYVDALAQGLDVKQSVRAATTANITLTGVQAVDGVVLVAGDRVLVRAQSATVQNGIYVVAAGAWTRATDFNSSQNATPGAFTFVEEGTLYADTGWVNATNGVITPGTTGIAWVQFSGAGAYAAGNGLTQSGTIFNVGPGRGILVSADSVNVDPAVVVRKYTTTIGDGVAKVFMVTHGLDSRDVTYSIRRAGSNEFVETDVSVAGSDALRLAFASAPAADSLHVVVHG